MISKKHLAMDHAMKVEQWEFEQSIVFSKSNIEKEADVFVSAVVYDPFLHAGKKSRKN